MPEWLIQPQTFQTNIHSFLVLTEKGFDILNPLVYATSHASKIEFLVNFLLQLSIFHINFPTQEGVGMVLRFYLLRFFNFWRNNEAKIFFALQKTNGGDAGSGGDPEEVFPLVD